MMDSALKQARLIWGGMLASSLLFVMIPEIVSPSERPVRPAVWGTIVLLTLWGVFGLSTLGRRIVQQSKELLRVTPNDHSAVRKWKTGHMLQFWMAENIVLWGLVLRFVGAALWQSVPWYVLGLGMLLMVRPKAVE